MAFIHREVKPYQVKSMYYAIVPACASTITTCATYFLKNRDTSVLELSDRMHLYATSSIQQSQDTLDEREKVVHRVASHTFAAIAAFFSYTNYIKIAQETFFLVRVFVHVAFLKFPDISKKCRYLVHTVHTLSIYVFLQLIAPIYGIYSPNKAYIQSNIYQKLIGNRVTIRMLWLTDVTALSSKSMTTFFEALGEDIEYIRHVIAQKLRIGLILNKNDRTSLLHKWLYSSYNSNNNAKIIIATLVAYVLEKCENIPKEKENILRSRISDISIEYFIEELVRLSDGNGELTIDDRLKLYTEIFEKVSYYFFMSEHEILGSSFIALADKQCAYQILRDTIVTTQQELLIAYRDTPISKQQILLWSLFRYIQKAQVIGAKTLNTIQYSKDKSLSFFKTNKAIISFVDIRDNIGRMSHDEIFELRDQIVHNRWTRSKVNPQKLEAFIPNLHKIFISLLKWLYIQQNKKLNIDELFEVKHP